MTHQATLDPGLPQKYKKMISDRKKRLRNIDLLDATQKNPGSKVACAETKPMSTVNIRL